MQALNKDSRSRRARECRGLTRRVRRSCARDKKRDRRSRTESPESKEFLVGFWIVDVESPRGLRDRGERRHRPARWDTADSRDRGRQVMSARSRTVTSDRSTPTSLTCCASSRRRWSAHVAPACDFAARRRGAEALMAAATSGPPTVFRRTPWLLITSARADRFRMRSDLARRKREDAVPARCGRILHSSPARRRPWRHEEIRSCALSCAVIPR